MDRVRSALFSILAPMGMENAVVADLFAGTGSLGIEALSRGAAHADFVESNTRQCADIRASLQATKFLELATVHETTVEHSLRILSGSYDFILMDPPYTQPFPVSVLEEIAGTGLLAPDAVLVVGHASRVPSPERCGSLERWQDRRYGDSSLAFYHPESPEKTL
jgi:16S rRNA (guanine966-N2)-methyltransferase